jgi:mono/diheme cytochrome c family protein
VCSHEEHLGEFWRRGLQQLIKGWVVGSGKVLPRNRLTKSVWIASLLVIAALLLLPSLMKLDGRTHADWQQFLGRFHPLAVHLPIGMILLLPLLESGARFRPALREAAIVVLYLAAFSCIGTLALGYLLAYGSGAFGPAVTRHMWGGISLTIGVLVCCLIRPLWASGKLPFAYPIMLASVVLVMAWAAHQGGSLTHGANYLTEYLPGPLRSQPGLRLVEAKAPLVPNSFYAQHIDPIFDANCVECHGQSKVKGGLRLDAYNLLMEGGTEGAVILAGKPRQSILFTRITLPTDHKKFMPAEGKPPLTPEQIAWINAWILQGASPAATSLAGVVVPQVYREAALPQVGDYSGMMAQISQLETSQGVKLTPVSKKLGDGLILNTVDAAAKYNDAQLAQLEKFAPYIVEVDLGRTGVTDACLDTLGKFTHLRAIHLEDTAITGQGLEKITRLSQLTNVNLSGTKVTKAAIAPLTSMPNLRHLYLYNTPAQPAATVPTQEPVARNSP